MTVNCRRSQHEPGICRFVPVTALLVAILVLITGCSTGSLAIRYLYGRFDNTLNERILAYAEFSEAQEAEIRQAVDDYVDWHRRNELPRYVELLDEVRHRLRSDSYDEALVATYLARLRAFSDRGFNRSPLVQAPEFLQRLSDEQVVQIAGSFERRRASFAERRAERERSGDSGRTSRVVKNIRRLGIRLTADQSEIIDSGLRRYRWQPAERRRLWRRWEREFLDMLQDRDSAGFVQDVAKHLGRYQKLARVAHPETDAWNQRNTARIIHDVLQSLDSEQLSRLVRRLDDTRNTLLAISRDS